MATLFNPGRASPEPGEIPMSDPFEIMIEAEGREALGLRYDYIANILEEEFEETYLRFFSASILHYEVINLVTLCSGLMRDTGFPKNEDDRFLRYSIIALIAEYLND
ncbi:hypothetical protein FO440_14460 [Mucilaginibacter corticis]|uniref:Uncharacterized protein n=1 Tax=Mucilaginibacter corticis TaxID=2597670 RepID=A0A556MM49_9SPHI|nr:hypothetical protein [Mucilaginibacter corticis]TSJ40935.1 hypothetical protein FO440_14460 [Mucilaginibacter corticis]